MANVPTVEIRVPQKDGEILISVDGNVDQPTQYDVKGGKVSVGEADVAHFLADVAGAELASGKADTAAAPSQ